MTNEPTVLTVDHLRAAGVPKQAIEGFKKVFPVGMPITKAGLIRATCVGGAYLAAIDHFRRKRNAGIDEQKALAGEEYDAIREVRLEYATKKREALASALAEAVRNLPMPMTLLDTETVKHIVESDDCAYENS